MKMGFSDTLPPGKWWIGDPCYVFPHDGPMAEKWDELLAKSNFLEGEMPVELDDGKIKVWAASTCYGDGRYPSSIGFDFPVDAGLIGIIPIETVAYLNRTDVDLNQLGYILNFKTPFCIKAEDGMFTFGHITINTCSDDYDEDDYDDDEE